MIHIVQAGDTLFQLSKKYGVTVNSLKKTNHLLYDGLWIGQRLTIPIVANSDSSNSSTPATTQYKSYTVQRGDSLYKIARKFSIGIEALKKINRLSSNFLSIGQTLKVPNGSSSSNSNTGSSNTNSGSNSSESSSNSGGNNGSSWAIYTVKKGDSLYKIATKFKIKVERLKQINLLSSNNLYIGQELKIPSGNSGENTSTPNQQEDNDNLVIYTVKSGDSLYTIAWIYNTTIDAIKQLNGLRNNSLTLGQELKVIKNRQDTNSDNSNTDNSNTDLSDTTPTIPTTDTEYEYYRVKGGDSLWSISRKFSIGVADLKQWNTLYSNSLRLGQLLKVGKKSGSSSPVVVVEEDKKEEGLTFDYQLRLQGAVGACDVNYGQDVRKVQERLLQLGFLSQTAFNAEQSPFSSTTISRWQLTETIEAIKTFQKVVMEAKKIDGCISPNHESLIFLNTAVAPISASKLQSIQSAYQMFNFKAVDGKTLMSSLQKAVGATNYGNLKQDLINLQKRLVDLGNLSQWHGETPSLKQTPPSKIHHTIAALKRFQSDRVIYWKGKTKHVGQAAQKYQYGIAAPNDLTHYLLQNFTDYRITFPLAKNPAVREAAEFRNFVKAYFTEDVTGIAYFGRVKAENIDLWEYRKLGLSNAEARALQYVSQHEGNFDAINSYDKALFSWGFIQFAGGNGGLVSMLAMMKHLQPETFKSFFQDFGIDVEYSIHTVRKDIREANLVIFDRFSGKLYRGLPAEQYLKDNKLLFGVFIRAAYDKNVQLAQIRAAKDKYVVPALNIKLNLRVPVVQKLSSNKQSILKTYVGPAAKNYKTIWEYRSMKQKGRIRESVMDFNSMPISKIIRSEMGMTVLIDLTVNQWIHKTRDLFMDAIYKVASQEHLSTVNKIARVNELKVLKLMETMAEPKLKYRIQNIRMNSGLSTAK
ncbi:MAG: LysM peptidoglycan-binding domain-containing protein [Chitinophagales bacterium]